MREFRKMNQVNRVNQTKQLVNFDNSATTFPKPQSVRSAVDSVFTRYGGNPGHGGHRLAIETAERIYAVRESAAEFFGAAPENVSFTANCTMALNMAIKGIMQRGGHIIISGYEHNAAFRPVYALAKKRTAAFSALPIFDDDDQTISELRRLIRRDTRAVCCTAASNVSGRILPYREIAAVCRSFGICFIADAAQAAGLLDITLDDGFDFICTAGHKALYGPSGTGLLVSSGNFTLDTIIEGGTGTNSEDPEQGEATPEKFESGTLNTVGIIGLGAGIEFVRRAKPHEIMRSELLLCQRLESRLERIDGIKLYRPRRRVPITAFNLRDIPSQSLSMSLSERGFALRGGLHCAPLAHRSIGTFEQGAVRFSPSVFSTAKQTDMLAAALTDIAGGR